MNFSRDAQVLVFPFEVLRHEKTFPLHRNESVAACSHSGRSRTAKIRGGLSWWRLSWPPGYPSSWLAGSVLGTEGRRICRARLGLLGAVGLWLGSGIRVPLPVCLSICSRVSGSFGAAGDRCHASHADLCPAAAGCGSGDTARSAGHHLLVLLYSAGRVLPLRPELQPAMDNGKPTESRQSAMNQAPAILIGLP